MTRTSPSHPQRGAFTLIELLVVIAIIAILSALTMAAVQRVRVRGQEVQARTDIQQLESALTAFKTKFGVYPPCSGGGAQGMYRLSTIHTGTEPEFAILKQIFPRITTGDNGLRILSGGAPTLALGGNLGSHGVQPTTPILLDPNQCLVFFLSGGVYTGYTGFGTNPAVPFAAPDTASSAVSGRLNNGPFYDGFISTRMLPYNSFETDYYTQTPSPSPWPGPANSAKVRFSGDAAFNPDRDQPWYVDPWGTPYLFFSSKVGNDYPFGAGSSGLQIGPFGGTFSPNNVTGAASTELPCFSFFAGSGANLKYANIRGVQIISAGRNKQFGNGGAHIAGSGKYALNRAGGDDWSNFQQTPLGATD